MAQFPEAVRSTERTSWQKRVKTVCDGAEEHDGKEEETANEQSGKAMLDVPHAL